MNWKSMTWPEEIQKKGFAVLPDRLSESELLRFQEELSACALRRTRAGIRHALTLPCVAPLAKDLRFLNIARKMLGEGAIPFRATFFEKSPASNWLVTWHQDRSIPLKRRHHADGWGPWSVKDGVTYAHAPASILDKVLVLRIHVDESNGLNGPLRVLPETHSLGILDDHQILKLAAEREPVDCVLPQGGVLAMRPLVVHSSSKSQTQMPRRILHIEYAVPSNFPSGFELAFA
jgi:hypothetical protein